MMTLLQNIPDRRALWAQRTFGDRQARNGTLASENFLTWFDGSKIVGADGMPLVVYHGSSHAGRILTHGFDPQLQGLGSDQYGAGFYFTDHLATAEGYRSTLRPPEVLAKMGAEESPGVLDVFLYIRKPIVVDLEANPECNCYDLWPLLTSYQARRLLLGAPRIRDEGGPLRDWGDVETLGFNKVLEQAVKAYAGGSPQTLDNDFYKGKANTFLGNYSSLTGHDGVIVKVRGQGGTQSTERHYVAWFPHQIKSASRNSGAFVPGSTDLTDSWAAPKERAVASLAQERIQESHQEPRERMRA